MNSRSHPVYGDVPPRVPSGDTYRWRRGVLPTIVSDELGDRVVIPWPTAPERSTRDLEQLAGPRRLRTAARAWLFATAAHLTAFGATAAFYADEYRDARVYALVDDTLGVELLGVIMLATASLQLLVLGANRNHVRLARLSLFVHSSLMFLVAWSFVVPALEGSQNGALGTSLTWALPGVASLAMMSERLGIAPTID